MKGLPLKIFVSTRTGRRYICCYLENRRRFMNFRLDCISKVKMTSVCEDYAQWKAALQKNLGLCWGVSFGGTGRGEEISVKFYIDEEKEALPGGTRGFGQKYGRTRISLHRNIF